MRIQFWVNNGSNSKNTLTINYFWILLIKICWTWLSVTWMARKVRWKRWRSPGSSVRSAEATRWRLWPCRLAGSWWMCRWSTCQPKPEHFWWTLCLKGHFVFESRVNKSSKWPNTFTKEEIMEFSNVWIIDIFMTATLLNPVLCGTKSAFSTDQPVRECEKSRVKSTAPWLLVVQWRPGGRCWCARLGPQRICRRRTAVTYQWGSTSPTAKRCRKCRPANPQPSQAKAKYWSGKSGFSGNRFWDNII